MTTPAHDAPLVLPSVAFRPSRLFVICLVFAGLVTVVAGLLSLLIYASSRRDLVGYLQRAGFPDQQLADSIAQFSLHEVMLFVLMLILLTALLTLSLSGVLSGARAKWAVVVLDVLMVSDLARADAPWIVYWNYKEKYATNPVIELLRKQPFPGRVDSAHARHQPPRRLRKQPHRCEYGALRGACGASRHGPERRRKYYRGKSKEPICGYEGFVGPRAGLEQQPRA